MYTATFTFIAKEFDAEFYELDNKIAAAAKAIPGYLGEKAWENPQIVKVSTVYHRLTKQNSSHWLEKHHLTIAQVLKPYSNAEINFTKAS